MGTEISYDLDSMNNMVNSFKNVYLSLQTIENEYARIGSKLEAGEKIWLGSASNEFIYKSQKLLKEIKTAKGNYDKETKKLNTIISEYQQNEQYSEKVVSALSTDNIFD